MFLLIQIMKIFVNFKRQIHTERLPPQICCSGSKLSSCKVSSLWDQQFCFFAQKCPIFHIFSLTKYFCKILIVVHHLKKRFTFFRSKISMKYILTFQNFYILNFYCLTHSAMQFFHMKQRTPLSHDVLVVNEGVPLENGYVVSSFNPIFNSLN